MVNHHVTDLQLGGRSALKHWRQGAWNQPWLATFCDRTKDGMRMGNQVYGHIALRAEQSEKRMCHTNSRSSIFSLLPKRGCLPRFVRREQVARAI
jgi:hypothetical protein